jgi:hypothetical protein
MADSQGNDVTAVAIPVTGFIGYAPAGTTIPTPVEGADPAFTLPVAYKKLGLLKVDGGPQWAWAPNGDPIEFWQGGYKIPTGLADVTVDVTLAQTDDNVRSVLYGKIPDANGFVIVDGGGSATEYVLFTEEIFKNGDIRRRVAPSAQVGAVSEDQSTRGDVTGYATTFTINSSSLLANGHFGEWLILAADNS